MDKHKRQDGKPKGPVTRRDFLRRGVFAAAFAGLTPLGLSLFASGCRGAQPEDRLNAAADSDFTPAYRKLSDGEFEGRVAALRDLMKSCSLCPRDCGVDRLAGEVGACRVGERPMVSSHMAHFGEERPLVGRNGSGTVFLSYCNLACVFCINYEISQLGRGHVVDEERLADMMLELQRRGCHNINWVTPTHQVPMMAAALQKAAQRGLRLPVVYNCGGYESLEALRLLDGVVDIYMPDAKYGDNAPGEKLSGVPDYWDRSQASLREMHRQVGDLQIGREGLATRGLLVRHLVMPDDICQSEKVMAFLASLSRDTYVNIMDQYMPTYRAHEFPVISRRITRDEHSAVMEAARQVGLHRFAV